MDIKVEEEKKEERKNRVTKETRDECREGAQRVEERRERVRKTSGGGVLAEQ